MRRQHFQVRQHFPICQNFSPIFCEAQTFPNPPIFFKATYYFQVMPIFVRRKHFQIRQYFSKPHVFVGHQYFQGPQTFSWSANIFKSACVSCETQIFLKPAYFFGEAPVFFRARKFFNGPPDFSKSAKTEYSILATSRCKEQEQEQNSKIGKQKPKEKFLSCDGLEVLQKISFVYNHFSTHPHIIIISCFHPPNSFPAKFPIIFP